MSKQDIACIMRMVDFNQVTEAGQTNKIFQRSKDKTNILFLREDGSSQLIECSSCFISDLQLTTYCLIYSIPTWSHRSGLYKNGGSCMGVSTFNRSCMRSLRTSSISRKIFVRRLLMAAVISSNWREAKSCAERCQCPDKTYKSSRHCEMLQEICQARSKASSFLHMIKLRIG